LPAGSPGMLWSPFWLVIRFLVAPVRMFWVGDILVSDLANIRQSVSTYLLVRCEKCFRLSPLKTLQAIAGPKRWMFHAPVIPLTLKRLRAGAPGPFTKFPGSPRSLVEVVKGTTIYFVDCVTGHLSRVVRPKQLEQRGLSIESSARQRSCSSGRAHTRKLLL
jgi:hypothetical protein